MAYTDGWCRETEPRVAEPKAAAGDTSAPPRRARVAGLSDDCKANGAALSLRANEAKAAHANSNIVKKAAERAMEMHDAAVYHVWEGRKVDITEAKAKAEAAAKSLTDSHAFYVDHPLVLSKRKADDQSPLKPEEKQQQERDRELAAAKQQLENAGRVIATCFKV